ncbi:MAG TPA: hypothetical protein VHL09_06730, partial [Dehalococcoidia bacterium]|nr:hypothetical protein [Dehalococcoidia bacterium]
VTFTLTVHFTTGGRPLTTETVTVKDLRPGRRQVVYLTASEPIPDPYDTARVEVEAMPAGD